MGANASHSDSYGIFRWFPTIRAIVISRLSDTYLRCMRHLWGACFSLFAHHGIIQEELNDEQCQTPLVQIWFIHVPLGVHHHSGG